MIDRDNFHQKINNGFAGRLERVEAKLRAQWSLREDRHCLHGDWSALARSVGLSASDIPLLKEWVSKSGLPQPMRKEVKAK